MVARGRAWGKWIKMVKRYQLPVIKNKSWGGTARWLQLTLQQSPFLMVSVTSSEPWSKYLCTTDLTRTSKKQLPLSPYYGFRGSEVLLSYIDQCHSNYKLQSLVGNGINLMDHYPLLGKKECRSEYITHENKCYVLKHLLRCEREGRRKSSSYHFTIWKCYSR